MFHRWNMKFGSTETGFIEEEVKTAFETWQDKGKMTFILFRYDLKIANCHKT